MRAYARPNASPPFAQTHRVGFHRSSLTLEAFNFAENAALPWVAGLLSFDPPHKNFYVEIILVMTLPYPGEAYWRNDMKKRLFGFLALIALLLTFAGRAQAALDLDFTLVNKTGYDIKELYIGPTSSDDWGDNVLSKEFKDGSTFELKFHPKATAEKWDIKVTYTDGETAEWKGYKLTEISKITLFWSKDKGSTAKAE